VSGGADGVRDVACVLFTKIVRQSYLHSHECGVVGDAARDQLLGFANRAIEEHAHPIQDWRMSFERDLEVSHTLLIPSSYPPHTLLILSSYSPHTLFIPSSYPPHTLLILSSYSPHTLFIPSSYPPHTLFILSSYLLRTHTLFILVSSVTQVPQQASHATRTNSIGSSTDRSLDASDRSNARAVGDTCQRRRSGVELFVQNTGSSAAFSVQNCLGAIGMACRCSMQYEYRWRAGCVLYSY
jgi:hypothetical protein